MHAYLTQFSKIFNDSTCSNSHVFNNDNPDGNYNNFTQFISLDDINHAFHKINYGLGWDKVHTFHLKYSGLIFRNLIAKIYNKFLSHNYVPLKYLKGQIKPVIKNTGLGKTNSTNYRPIMNSPNFLKIFEICLSPYLERHLVLNKRQFGFRPKTSCQSAHVMLKEIINKYTSQRSNVHCAMIDLSKAFDKVNHSLLIKLMAETSLPIQIVNTIRFMLMNTSTNVFVNNVATIDWQVTNGTRQGGIISPIKFSYFLNHIIDKVSDMDVGCTLAGERNNILCYADDVCLLAPTPEALQTLIDVFIEEINISGLTINVDKCAYIVFKHKKSHEINSVVTINSQNIKRVNEVKYLGIILSENNNISADITRITNCFLKQFNGLYAKFYYFCNPVLHHLYKSYATSFYGIELWYSDWKNKDLHKFAVTYHKAIKKIARLNVWDSNHEACSLVGVPIFTHLMAKRILSFFYSVINSQSICLVPYKYYFKYASSFNCQLNLLMENKYGVKNFKLSPLCALVARLCYMERNEPRSYNRFQPIPNDSNL